MPTVIEPKELVPGKGYSNGMLMDPGRTLFVAGQIGWNRDAELAPGFSAQFSQALANVVATVRAAGGEPAHIGRLTVYVTDKRAYLNALADVGAAYRQHMGRHYPAMALVQVADLLEEGAMVEVEATAVLPAEEGAA